MDILRTNNTGVCKRIGKSFGELIKHFISEGEEKFLISEVDGSMEIIGEFGRKNHEKRVLDCHASCTMYQTGTAGRSNGPNVFDIKGKIIMTGYIEKMMKENGSEHVSTVVMTDNTFMKEEAWMLFTPMSPRGIGQCRSSATITSGMSLIFLMALVHICAIMNLC